MGSANNLVVDGVTMKRSCLLPDFPGAAPPAYQYTYHLREATAGTQSDAAAAPARPAATGPAAAAGRRSRARGHQAEPLGAELQTSLPPQRLVTAIRVIIRGVEGAEQVTDAGLLEEALAVHRTLPNDSSDDLVRISFMGEGKLEAVMSKAVSGSIPDLWQNGSKIIRSVLRQVWLRTVP